MLNDQCRLFDVTDSQAIAIKALLIMQPVCGAI